MPFVDPYIDECSDVLRNLLGARSQTELNKSEADLTALREYELRINPNAVSRKNNFSELLAIHKYLFQDIYDWAGEIRSVDIRKNLGCGQSSELFLIVSRIEFGANYVFNELKSENFLKNLEKAKFVERLAYFYDQLNYIHPFREGNGRAQRVFWTRVALAAGYEIDWTLVQDGENDDASRIAAEKQDLSLLESMFDRIVKKQFFS
jgi:cell filamentation protein